MSCMDKNPDLLPPPFQEAPGLGCTEPGPVPRALQGCGLSSKERARAAVPRQRPLHRGQPTST